MSAAPSAPLATAHHVRGPRDAMGLLYGVGAYAVWGMFPAFFGLLSFAGPVEIVAHRIVWTLVLMLAVLAVTGKLSLLRRIGRRTWVLVGAGALSISLNWGIYVYAVLSGHVAEAALGYFINPLVTVAIGIVAFGEHTSRACRLALGIAGAAVAVVTVAYHHLPFIALSLAGSFALYGVVKKLNPIPPAVSLTAETVLLAPVAVGFLAWQSATVAGGLLGHGFGQLILLVLCGPMTAAPLLLFGAAAHRLPVVSLGVLQYVTPILQLLWAVLVCRETILGTTWFGFALIWVALAIFTADVIRQASRRQPLAATRRADAEDAQR